MQSNDYLEQVVQQQPRVEGELRRHKAPQAPPAAAPVPEVDSPSMRMAKRAIFIRDEEEAPVGQGVDYRITGWWFWKSVVVPPNVYVVHTRRGHPEPLHL